MKSTVLASEKVRELLDTGKVTLHWVIVPQPETDFSQIRIFVTRDKNGLIDTYRVEYDDTPIYDRESEV